MLRHLQSTVVAVTTRLSREFRRGDGNPALTTYRCEMFVLCNIKVLLSYIYPQYDSLSETTFQLTTEYRRHDHNVWHAGNVITFLRKTRYSIVKATPTHTHAHARTHTQNKLLLWDGSTALHTQLNKV